MKLKNHDWTFQQNLIGLKPKPLRFGRKFAPGWYFPKATYWLQDVKNKLWSWTTSSSRRLDLKYYLLWIGILINLFNVSQRCSCCEKRATCTYFWTHLVELFIASITFTTARSLRSEPQSLEVYMLILRKKMIHIFSSSSISAQVHGGYRIMILTRKSVMRSFP